MKLVSVNYHLFADLFGTIFVSFLLQFAARSKLVNLNVSEVQYEHNRH